MRRRPRCFSIAVSVRRSISALLWVFVLTGISLMNLNCAYLKLQLHSGANDDKSRSASIRSRGLDPWSQPSQSRAANSEDFVSPVRNLTPRTMQAKDGGPLMLIDPERTLWTAGWNARHTNYYEDVAPAISWTAQAEEIFEREYRRLHFPKDLSQVNG